MRRRPSSFARRLSDFPTAIQAEVGPVPWTGSAARGIIVAMRLAIFNVHGWCDAQRRKRVDDVIALLREIDADVIVLNEVVSPDHLLARVADALGRHAYFVVAGFGGNAVLTRGAPLDVAEVALDAAPDELRSAAIVRVELDGVGPIDVVGTHLEHTREDHRLLQWRQLRTYLSHRAARHVVAGDFNAMRLTDLSEAERVVMQRERERRQWEPAREDVVADLDAHGYVDAVRLALADGSRAAYRAALGQPIARSHAVTSRVATRIDHVYLSPALAEVATARAARTVATDVSDHRLVWVELAPGARD